MCLRHGPFWWPWHCTIRSTGTHFCCNYKLPTKLIHVYWLSWQLIVTTQGFTRSHWMLPSGNYSLRIVPSAARGTINKTTIHNVPTFLLAIFMAITMRQQRYDTAHIAWWMRFLAFIKATKRHHWTSTCSNITQSSIGHANAGCFGPFIVKKGSSWHVGP